MFEQPQDFQFLRRVDLDRQLSSIFRHWDPPPMERAEFVGWAWVVAAASDLSATENVRAAVDQLRGERDLVNQEIVNRCVASARVDVALVSKRMFLEWLRGQLVEAARLAA